MPTRLAARPRPGRSAARTSNQAKSRTAHGPTHAAATTVQGSGWAALGWDTLGNKLLIFQVYDHQSNFPLGIVPLLLLDMWEHAFYLQYKNVKVDFAKAFWNVVNWADVQARYAAATSKTAGLLTP